jgi:hypothetical protein
VIRFLAAMLLAHAAAADAAALASGRNWRIAIAAIECEAAALLVIRTRVHFLGRAGAVEAPVSRLSDAQGSRYFPKSVIWKEDSKALAQWLSSGGLRAIDAGALGEVELKFDLHGAAGALKLEFGDIAAFALTRKNSCLKLGELQAPRVASPARVEKSNFRANFRVYRAGYPCGAARLTKEAEYPPYLPKQLLLFGRGYLPSAREVDLPMGTAPAQPYSYAGEDNLKAVEDAARRAVLADFPHYTLDRHFAFNWGSQKGASGNELYSIGLYEVRSCPGNEKGRPKAPS